jgi:hypothetical protein
MCLGRLLLLICLVVRPAAAAEPTDSPAAGATARGPFLLRLYSDSDAPSNAELTRALALELDAEMLAPHDPGAGQAGSQITISYSKARGELAVTYFHPVRGTLTRLVPAPSSSDGVASTAALLAGNLVRNEAEELLGPPPAATSPTVPSGPARVATSPPAAEERRPPAATTEDAPPERLANASFFYPLAANYSQPNLRTHLDLNLIYGHIGALDGLELGTINVVDGSVRGAQIALVANIAAARVEGIELALLFNHASSTVSGLQIGGAFNRARGYVQGLQATAGANIAEGSVLGGQASVFGFNYAKGAVDGLQLAPLANLTVGHVSGLQVAFGLNRAGDVSGAQIGLVNIGRNVRGAQIGLLNFADDVDGVPIGLVSVTRSGGVHPSIWSSNTTYGNFGLKFATRYTYTMLSAGVHQTGDALLAGPGFTIGGSVPVLPKTSVEIDVQALHLFANTACCERYFFGAAPRAKDWSLGKLRALARYAFLPHLSAFAGTGLTGRVRYPLDDDGDTDVNVDFGSEVFGGIQL